MKTFAGIVLTTLFLLTSVVYAQSDIEVKLNGSKASSGFTVMNSSLNEIFTVRGNGHIGIGVMKSLPFKFNLGDDGGILAIGTIGAGVDLTVTGEGSRLFWYPKKAAFRAGKIISDQWNNTNIGSNSVAFGQNTKASGFASSALGS